MNKRSLLAGPYIVWIIGFTVLPILMIIFYALGDGDGGLTMSNILAIFQPVHLKAQMCIRDRNDAGGRFIGMADSSP